MPRIPANRPSSPAPPAASPTKPAAAVAPLATLPISTKEEDLAFAPLLDEAQKAALATVDDRTRAKLRDLSRAIRNCNTQSGDLKNRRSDLTREWLGLFNQTKLGAVPCVDPVTREPLLAYVRSDEMMFVDPTDLREFLDEHYRVTLGEDAELAATHVLDIMGQVLKPEAIDNAKFKALVANGTIDGQVAAACTTISNKEPYVAFGKPGS